MPRPGSHAYNRTGDPRLEIHSPPVDACCTVSLTGSISVLGHGVGSPSPVEDAEIGLALLRGAMPYPYSAESGLEELLPQPRRTRTGWVATEGGLPGGVYAC